MPAALFSAADRGSIALGSVLAAERVTLGSAVACPRNLRLRAVGIDGRAWTDAEVKGA